VVLTYIGLDTPEMEFHVTTYAETSIGNNVSSIREMRRTTLQGITIQPPVIMRNVSIERDFGTGAELRDGLAGGERLAPGLPADVNDGGKIKPAGGGG